MAQTITITAVPLDRHGYNISCFGDKDGAIDISVTGGTPPYAYDWSNGSRNEDVQDLPAGFYAITVTDALGEQARMEITLTEPAELKPYIVPYEYPNGYNVSSYNSYNGTLDLVPVGGATPYTYLWTDGPTTEDRSLLGSDNYSVTITDANGCTFKTEQVYLRAPERSDWTMNGNVGTNPATQFLGTSDNKDVVFKSNGMERLRLISNGDIKLFGTVTGSGPLYRDGNGVMKMGGFEDLPVYPCAPDLRGHPYWKSTGNTFPTLCPGVAPPVLGTRNAFALSIITNDIQRALITPSGNIGMGDGVTMSNMTGLLTLRTGWNDWLTFKNEPDPNIPGDAAWSWHFHNTGSKDRLILNNQNADGTPGPANITFWNNGKVSIGDVSTTSNDYLLFVQAGNPHRTGEGGTENFG